MSKLCIETQKLAYVVYFVIEVLCENLFNLGSKKLLRCSLYYEGGILWNEKHAMSLLFFWVVFLIVDHLKKYDWNVIATRNESIIFF